MSFNDFMKRSHVEIDVFLSFAKKENEEYSKKDGTGIGRMANMIADQ
jgi:tRNA nucleotidyltransferase (CCA-adding enzyme)